MTARTAPAPCLNGGTRHAWETRGLDLDGPTLVATRRCVWCQAEQVRTYTGNPTRRPSWRNRKDTPS